MHERKRDANRGSPRDRGYGGDWSTIRKRVKKEQPWCANNDGRPTVQVHHIIPLSQGGTHDRSNLVGLCVECHNAITNKR